MTFCGAGNRARGRAFSAIKAAWKGGCTRIGCPAACAELSVIIRDRTLGFLNRASPGDDLRCVGSGHGTSRRGPISVGASYGYGFGGFALHSASSAPAKNIRRRDVIPRSIDSFFFGGLPFRVESLRQAEKRQGLAGEASHGRTTFFRELRLVSFEHSAKTLPHYGKR